MRWTCALLVLSIIGCCVGPELGAAKSVLLTHKALTQDARELQIIPWVECNWPDVPVAPEQPSSLTVLEHVAAGLEAWEPITTTAMVSTLPGNAAIYAELQARLREVQIIPGLKTQNLLVPFDSAAGWAQVAAEVRTLLEMSDERRIVLDHEAALRPFVLGRQIVNLTRLREGLGLLPRDVQYVWHPSLYWFVAGEAGYRRLLIICRLVDECLPDVRWVDQRYCASDTAHNDRYRQAAIDLGALVRGPTMPILYFLGDDYGYTWWADDQVGEALGQIESTWGPGAEVIIYPGVRHWAAAAGLFRAALDDHCSAADMVDQIVGPGLCPMPTPVEAECDLNNDNCVDLRDVAILQLTWQP